MASDSAQITRMSSKGQIVIPEEIRDDLSISSGSLFAVFGRRDAGAILLKRLELPEPHKAFEEMAKWGEKHVAEKGLDASPEKIVELQHKSRLRK